MIMSAASRVGLTAIILALMGSSACGDATETTESCPEGTVVDSLTIWHGYWVDQLYMECTDGSEEGPFPPQGEGGTESSGVCAGDGGEGGVESIEWYPAQGVPYLAGNAPVVYLTVTCKDGDTAVFADGVSPDSWNLGEAIFQSCDEGESVSGLTYEVEEFDFSSDYTYDGSGIYGDYVITSISLECSVVGSELYPLCDVPDEEILGSGYCSSEYNTEECGYDGGDCCECTCEDTEDNTCGPIFQCKDPEADCYGDAGSDPYPECDDVGRLANGFCDPEVNTEECGWDGGDCCECTCVTEDATCGPTFQCLNPDAECFGEEGQNPYPECENPGFVGTGYCTEESNTEECGWDGGDCCECTCVDGEHSCDDTDFACLDPAGFACVEDGFYLTVSTCDFDQSGDKIEFYTCSGGPQCVMSEDPKKSAYFTTDDTQVLAINDDVEPTTLVISKPAGTDGWCVDGIQWTGGENLLAPSTVIYFDASDGDEGNCEGGVKDHYGVDAPCTQKWRFFNLQGDADFEYELKVQGCDGEVPAPFTASFCPDISCNSSAAVTQTLTALDTGTTIFPVQLDFNPVAIQFLASETDEWCAEAMSFNGFDLAEAYPYTLAAGESRMVKNIQNYGEAATPAPTTGLEPTEQEEEDGVWFEALWEIVVTIVGGIALTCILGVAGVLYRRWRRKQGVEEDDMPRPSFQSPLPPANGTAEELPHYDDRRSASTAPSPAVEGVQADGDLPPPPYASRATSR